MTDATRKPENGAAFDFDTAPEPTAWRDPERVSDYSICDQVLNSAKDGLPEHATQAQIDGAVYGLVLGILRKPRTMATVRRKLRQMWPAIAPLADREPDLFDSILNEFAERASERDG